jgi:hypothetical protein
MATDGSAISFTDHSGDLTPPGYMVFQNYVNIPLPPLFPFIIYFTHIDTLPSMIDLEGLYGAITVTGITLRPRFDVYFLPGATEIDCLSH